MIVTRKKRGIQTIRRDESGRTIDPKIFHQEHKNPEQDGLFVKDYKSKMLPGSRQYFSPVYDGRKGWSWKAPEGELTRLIKLMKLTYPDWHHKAGNIIEPEDEPTHIHRFDDPVFRNPEFYGKYFMEDGVRAWDPKDPHHQFMIYCLKGNVKVEDSTSDKVRSKAALAGTDLELVSPSNENKATVSQIKGRMAATKLLEAMEGDEERQRAICTIMRLRSYSPNTDAPTVFTIVAQAAFNEEPQSRLDGKSEQARFIELANLPTDELLINAKIMEGKARGYIRRQKDYYDFQGTRIDAKTDAQMIAYFRDPKNQDEYIRLEELLKLD